MNFGIDAISFYTTNYYLDLENLAQKRGQDATKFYESLGQKKMAVMPPNEDIITLAANAAVNILDEHNTADIEMVIFATETSFDHSKAAATYIHKLFNLPERCRAIELKQACYSATFGLQMGLAWLHQNPGKKVLLLASDTARYALNTPAEASQGCGAVAMLLSANPKILVIEPAAGFCTREAMDFWRPNYCDCAIVDGRLSCDVYMRLAEDTWLQYTKLTQRDFFAHDRFCYHVPLARLVERTHKRLAKINGRANLTPEEFDYQIGNSLIYNREIGNCYTASLYLSIISLLENTTTDLGGKLLGLYSYGSGSVAEFFAARVVPGYQTGLPTTKLQPILNARQELSITEYENFYHFKTPTDGNSFEFPMWQTGKFCLKSLKHHQRIYEKIV